VFVTEPMSTRSRSLRTGAVRSPHDEGSAPERPSARAPTRRARVRRRGRGTLARGAPASRSARRSGGSSAIAPAVRRTRISECASPGSVPALGGPARAEVAAGSVWAVGPDRGRVRGGSGASGGSSSFSPPVRDLAIRRALPRYAWGHERSTAGAARAASSTHRRCRRTGRSCSQVRRRCDRARNDGALGRAPARR
jgi:hypothetical protein